VDDDDLARVVFNLGAGVVPPVAGAATHAAVPEPASALLLLLVLSAAGAHRLLVATHRTHRALRRLPICE
jgi:hypothetical protein